MRNEPRKELKAVAAAAGASNGVPENTSDPQEVKQAREKQLKRTEQQQQRFFEQTHMLTISKPLSAGQVRAYHSEEFGNARENYYTKGDKIHGEWQGRLAEQWGLRGEVREEQFHRLSEGQHPITGEQLVRQLYTNDAAKLSEALSRNVSKRAALDVEVNRIQVQGAQCAVKQPSPSNAPQGEQVGRGQAHGQSVGHGGGQY